MTHSIRGQHSSGPTFSVLLGLLWVGGLGCDTRDAASTSSTTTSTAVAAQPVTVETEDVARLQARLGSGEAIQLIDVRTPEEFAAGHVQGARNIPLDVVLAGQDGLSHQEQPYYLICRSGNRSGKAAAALARRGQPVVNISGGMLAWEGAGFPAVR